MSAMRPRDGALVDAARHLVEQEEARAGRHGAGELEALSLPGAEPMGVHAAPIEQPHEVEGRERRVARPAHVRIVLHDAHHDVLLDRHLGKGL